VQAVAALTTAAQDSNASVSGEFRDGRGLDVVWMRRWQRERDPVSERLSGGVENEVAGRCPCDQDVSRSGNADDGMRVPRDGVGLGAAAMDAHC